jgi:uncharacterized membrane protein
MASARKVVIDTIVGGLLILVPIYLAVLLVAKAVGAVLHLLDPVTALLPEWVPLKALWSVLFVVLLCFLVGAAVRTKRGRRIRARVEAFLFGDLPGYALIRGLTDRIAGTGDENTWKPALAEIEEALVPAFIIEALDDGRLTVFVPSVPTPFAGAVYILVKERVHPLDVPFTHAIKSISRWGSGSGELVAALHKSGA